MQLTPPGVVTQRPGKQDPFSFAWTEVAGAPGRPPAPVDAVALPSEATVTRVRGALSVPPRRLCEEPPRSGSGSRDRNPVKVPWEVRVTEQRGDKWPAAEHQGHVRRNAGRAARGEGEGGTLRTPGRGEAAAVPSLLRTSAGRLSTTRGLCTPEAPRANAESTCSLKPHLLFR